MGKAPTDTQCPVCLNVFQQPVRKHGGGARKIYCSPNCRSTDWARGNGAKRKATVLQYESRPENKEKKRMRERLRKYKLTRQEFETLLARQKNRCGGCNDTLTITSARIDHDHKTGQVRGALCDKCNWALGHASDDRGRLYQLAAYLELDRTKPVLYLIGSLRNPKVVALGNDLRTLGYEVVDNWFAAGKIADESWQEYSTARGRTYQEALESREAKHVFYFDRAYLRLSDIVVMLYPAGRSAHLEFGYAVGQGKPGYLLMEKSADRYDVMLQFAGCPLFQDKGELLNALSLTAREVL